MTIYWIVEAFTEHPDVRSRPPPSRILSDPVYLQLADWHEFTGPTGVKAKCKQVSHIAGWMPTIAMDGQVVTSHPGIIINASGGMGMGGTGGIASNTSIGFTDTNAATGTHTITAHSHILITNAITANATVNGSPNPVPISRKRRLEEDEEADNDRHRTQRRKFTHSYEPVSDGYSSGYESSHHSHYLSLRPMHEDLHRDLQQAVSQVAVSGGHRPTSRPASKSASRATGKRRSKRRMTTRSVSVESLCDCLDPNCTKPLYIPITVGPGTQGPQGGLMYEETESSSGMVNLFDLFSNELTYSCRLGSMESTRLYGVVHQKTTTTGGS